MAEPVKARMAATVLLARDGAEGLTATVQGAEIGAAEVGFLSLAPPLPRTGCVQAISGSPF